MKKTNMIISSIMTLVLLFLTQTAQASTQHLEKEYQNYWCQKHGGETEVILEDKTRIDCLLKDYAIEFDFAKKWCEAIGQSLYYGHMTNRKAGIVLILEDKAKDVKYLERLCKIAPAHGITVWTISPTEIN